MRPARRPAPRPRRRGANEPHDTGQGVRAVPAASLMPPTPLHGPGARRRFARQIREATLRSTDRELLALDALEAAVRAGDISVLEASERVRLILREQHARQQAA